MTNILRLLVILCGICLGGAAQAQIVWSMSAVGCVVTDVAIRADRYRTNLGSVQHAATKVGPITMNCPVTLFDTQGMTEWQVGLNARDSTGTDPAATVRARLYMIAYNGTEPTVLAAVHSDVNPNVTTDTVRSSSVFIHTFDFGVATYWIRVDLDRDAADQIVKVNTVHIRVGPQ